MKPFITLFIVLFSISALANEPQCMDLCSADKTEKIVIEAISAVNEVSSDFSTMCMVEDKNTKLSEYCGKTAEEQEVERKVYLTKMSDSIKLIQTLIHKPGEECAKATCEEIQSHSDSIKAVQDDIKDTFGIQ